MLKHLENDKTAVRKPSKAKDLPQPRSKDDNNARSNTTKAIRRQSFPLDNDDKYDARMIAEKNDYEGINGIKQ